MPYVGNCGESSGAYYPVSGRVSADDSDSETSLGWDLIAISASIDWPKFPPIQCTANIFVSCVVPNKHHVRFL